MKFIQKLKNPKVPVFKNSNVEFNHKGNNQIAKFYCCLKLELFE